MGVGQAFEGKSEWQAAWARYRTGNSTIDYVRPAGNGPDALLLNVSQTGRPGRGWWRTILDQYGATGVLIPTVRLYRQWPGGPIVGVFQARFGADNRLLGAATLRVGSDAGLPALLDAGVAKLDDLYQRGLRSGFLNPDPSLLPMPVAKPVEETPADGDQTLDQIIGNVAGGPASGQGIAITLQFDTPGAGAVSATGERGARDPRRPLGADDQPCSRRPVGDADRVRRRSRDIAHLAPVAWLSGVRQRPVAPHPPRAAIAAAGNRAG